MVLIMMLGHAQEMIIDKKPAVLLYTECPAQNGLNKLVSVYSKCKSSIQHKWRFPT